MTSPRTEAGRALLDREALNSRSFTLIEGDAVLAIEAEAREQALAEIEEAVRGQRFSTGFDSVPIKVANHVLDAVLAAIETARRNSR